MWVPYTLDVTYPLIEASKVSRLCPLIPKNNAVISPNPRIAQIPELSFSAFWQCYLNLQKYVLASLSSPKIIASAPHSPGNKLSPSPQLPKTPGGLLRVELTQDEERSCHLQCHLRTQACFCLFDLILYVPSTIFQLCRDGSSWVEPVLS